MARLHPRLQDALPLLPIDRPVHLLTRHSVRELAKNGFADYRLPLTPEGVAMARDWGRQLPRPVAAFHSSPVGRCVDTALAMYEGGRERGLAGHDLEVRHETVLVEPGCYVEDIMRVGPLFFELGAVGFINRHLQGDLAGVLEPEAGLYKLGQYLREREPGGGELAVHVTHDTILAAFMAGLAGREQISEADWPWMMEGAWLWFEDERLHWVWRGEPGIRALPF